jgi:deazaflavin-dependent oxidoreductase (nitroreductase family)
MSKVERIPRFIWRLMKFLPPRLLYSVGLGFLVGHFVLLMETTGRKSGLPRITPLQYDEIDGTIYVGSARGVKADWFQNLAANPNVKLKVGSRQFTGYAKPFTDPAQIADFLALRLHRRPKFVGTLLRLEGLSPSPTREELLEYAANRAFVAIHPSEIVANR